MSISCDGTATADLAAAPALRPGCAGVLGLQSQVTTNVWLKATETRPLTALKAQPKVKVLAGLVFVSPWGCLMGSGRT